MSAELMLTLVADDIRREDNRKLIIVGLYNKAIIFREEKETYALPQLCIFQRFKVDSQGHTARLEFIDPDGEVRGFPDHELRPTAEGDYYQLIVKMHGILLKPGRYTIRTTLDEQVWEEPLVVRSPQD